MMDLSELDQKDFALIGLGVMAGVAAGIVVGMLVKVAVQEIDRADPEFARDVLRGASDAMRKARRVMGDDPEPKPIES